MTEAGIKALPVGMAISKLIDKKITLNSANHPAAIERTEQEILWLEDRITLALSDVGHTAR